MYLCFNLKKSLLGRLRLALLRPQVAWMGAFDRAPPHMYNPPPAARRPPGLIYYEVDQVGILGHSQVGILGHLSYPKDTIVFMKKTISQ